MTLNHNIITVKVRKSSSQSSGLFLYKDEQNRIVVNSILSGIFENTDLKPLMEIVSVNSINCEGMTEDFVTSLVDHADGEVTIVARDVIHEAEIIYPTPSAPTVPIVSNPPVAVPVTQNLNQRPPANGQPSGGVWRKVRYAGDKTTCFCIILCLLFGIFSCCGAAAYACPQDMEDVYVINGKV